MPHSSTPVSPRTSRTLRDLRPLVDELARGLATSTDRPARRDLAAALRRATAGARRVREARRALEDLHDDWMCSRSRTKQREGVRAVALALRYAFV